MMSCPTRLVRYMPSLNVAATAMRGYAAHDEHSRGTYIYVTEAPSQVKKWPDKSLGPFGPKDKSFPLPGNVGSKYQLELTKYHPDDGFLPEEPSAQESLECAAHDCPQMLRKDFQSLFPNIDICHGTLSVITISQKTENDMTKWNPAVEIEREEMLATFVQGAQDICAGLSEEGYWADFIDPSSGRPYLGQFTNSTMFETDERYRHFGFEIDDLGCCKVIRHHLWGSRAFVGCLFTSASIDSPIMQRLLHKEDSAATSN